MNKGTLEAIFKIYPQTDAEKEVREWLKINSAHFTADKWSQVEVAHMAMYLGFERNAVYTVLSFWDDAIQGSRFENRSAMQRWSLTCAAEEVTAIKGRMDYVKELDLKNQWQALTEYGREGIEFQEVK